MNNTFPRDFFLYCSKARDFVLCGQNQHMVLWLVCVHPFQLVFVGDTTFRSEVSERDPECLPAHAANFFACPPIVHAIPSIALSLFLKKQGQSITNGTVHARETF